MNVGAHWAIAPVVYATAAKPKVENTNVGLHTYNNKDAANGRYQKQKQDQTEILVIKHAPDERNVVLESV